MKHFFSRSLAAAVLLLAIWHPARAQSETAQQATELALQTRAQWAGPGLTAADVRISSAHTEAPGLLYAYPQQLQAGIPVYNQVVALVFKNGKLAHHAGAFLSPKAFAGLPAAPQVPAATAVATAVATLPGHPSLAPASLESATGPARQQRFAPAGVARRPIEVRLVWATDHNRAPRLAWNVNVDVLASPDWLNIRVDAATGQVLGQDNWTVEENAAHRPAAPVPPAGASAGAAPAPHAWALRQPGSAKSTLAATPASYTVVPFPGERPDVTPVATVTSPWLRAGAGNPVATYGWHFDGLVNYTTTRGNNVAAYDDAANADAPGNYAASTTAAPSLSFPYTPSFTAAPTTVGNRNAAVTNLFYWNNLMHDVMYQYGFTEAASNFQADNQGRGGLGGDYVNAEAQDGGGTNNANFNTPPEGLNSRMQMYLWAPRAYYTLQVTAPSAIAGSYGAVEGTFSTNNKLSALGPVSGQLAAYVDAGSSPATGLACVAHGGASLANKIVLLYRGSCNFTDKVKNAQLAGARAVIVVNNAAGAATVMGGTDNTVTVPAVMVSQADGAILAAQLANGVQVTLPRPAAAGTIQLDGDFDSGIIAHEYGHGISNRLTGGGANTSCLYNAEQAGEGWSDFFALMMTTNWATAQTTDGPNARPVGTYVYSQPTTAPGLRRFPYSTSLAVNPLTYADMTATPEVHAIGEIWCATLWDMAWNIIQAQGSIEPNLYASTSTGGNAVALQLVMQGLKMQPCQPGFLDSRDAILAADSLLYNGRYHCAIWGAFARRGMGFSAREGASTSATDQTAAFDLPGVSLRKFTAPVAGNQFAINLSASCECQTQAPVTITDQLPAGLEYVSSTGGTLSGSTVSFAGLSFAAGQRRALRIVARTAAGAGCAVALPVNDDREANTLGGFAPAVVSGSSTAWVPTTARAHSGTTSWSVSDPGPYVDATTNFTTDATLTSAPFTPTGFSVLSFYHYFSTESVYDGGMVGISVNNGAWQDAATFFVHNGYNSAFTAGTASAGKPCFSGVSSTLAGPAAFQNSVINLTSFAGQSIRVRFQFQCDNANYTTLPGWFVDDIQVMNGCGGLQQVQLLNNANAVTASYAQTTFLAVPVVAPAPVITLLNPMSGPVGTSVTVTGTDLATATGLTLNGTAILASAITANTATSLTFTVPAGATTGLLTVTTAAGTSNGLTFTVIQDLVISTPGQTIAPGTYRTITITGSGVGSLPASGTVAVTGAFLVQGRFNAGAGTSPVGGTGTFALSTGGYLYSALPLYTTGALGAVQTAGSRTFASDATYEFGGTGTATGPGLPATVTNLFLSPSGTVQLTQPVAIGRELRLTSGTFNLGGQGLALLSDATTTAQVNQDGVTTTGTVTGGSATVQRYIAANGNAGLGYRHLSSPVGGNRLDDLAVPGGFQPVFNPAYNTSAASSTSTPFPTVFGFDPSRMGSAPSSYSGLDQGYYSPATGTAAAPVADLFTPGRGYTVNLAAGQTVDFVGPLNQAVMPLNLTRAAGTATPDDGKGWQLLGNPFASSFALSSLDNTPGMDNAKYIFQSTGPYTGSYQTVLGTISGQPLLAVGQAFFARVTTPGTAPTLTFALAGRRVDFTANSTFHRTTAETRPLLELELASANGSLRDRTTLYADASATAGLDAAYDAMKLGNPHGLNLSQQLAGRQLALNALPAFTSGTVVPLTVGVPAAGSYALLVNQLLNLPAGTAAVLVDTQLNTRTDLATLPATGYAFSVSAAQAATALTGRFYLNVGMAAPLATAAGQKGALMQLYPNPAKTEATLTGTTPGTRVTVYDALGRRVTTATANATGTATLELPAGLAAGVYLVRAGTAALRLTVE